MYVATIASWFLRYLTSVNFAVFEIKVIENMHKNKNSTINVCNWLCHS